VNLEHVGGAAVGRAEGAGIRSADDDFPAAHGHGAAEPAPLRQRLQPSEVTLLAPRAIVEHVDVSRPHVVGVRGADYCRAVVDADGTAEAAAAARALRGRQSLLRSPGGPIEGIEIRRVAAGRTGNGLGAADANGRAELLVGLAWNSATCVHTPPTNWNT